MIEPLSWTWFGLVLGVSFLATPIKFRAKSLTMPVALDVGRTTFHAFAKVEWLLSIALVAGLLASDLGDSQTLQWCLALSAIGIVITQAAYLIPRLDIRVAAVIDGNPLPPAPYHRVFAGLEAAKAVTVATLALAANGTF